MQNKEAFATSVLTGAGLGGGAVAAMALIKELIKNKQDEEESKKNQQLSVLVPKEKLNKQAEGETTADQVQSNLANVLGFGGGVVGGGYGVAKLIEAYKNRKQDEEMDKAKRQYMAALQATQMNPKLAFTVGIPPIMDAFEDATILKSLEGGDEEEEDEDTKKKKELTEVERLAKKAMAANTPRVDAFCDGVASSFMNSIEKQGIDWVGRYGSTLSGGAGKSALGVAGLSAAGLIALLAMGGTYGLGKYKQQQKEDKEREANQVPSSVNLIPV